jgi:phage tail sheath protein FI
MPEYLSPGVFVEEVPGRLKALEGVSTSTAAFVGPARRGPIAGAALPFTPAGGFTLEADRAPVFLTSFAEFVRRFGFPLPLVTNAADPDTGYLGYAVKAFFDNGGRRCYITRIVTSAATSGEKRARQGVVYHLVRSAKTGDTTVYFQSLRGLNQSDALVFRRRSDGSTLATLNAASYNTLANSVTLSGALAVDLDPAEVYAAVTAPPTPATGPRFVARSPGAWSGDVGVQIVPVDRVPVKITVAAVATASVIEVQSASTFYLGAVVEIDHGTTRTVHEVIEIDGRKLTLGDTLGAAVVAGTSSARVLEIDVLVSDDSGAAPLEVYRGLTWSQGATSDLRRHYASVINAQSRLVWVQPPGISGLTGSEGAGASVPAYNQQPTTANGFAEKLSEGLDGLPSQAASGDAAYIGTDGGPGLRTGIESFKDLLDVRLIAAPGRTSNAVQLALISQCELLRYRFALLDARLIDQDPMAILAHRNLYDTSFAGYYAPWLGVTIDGQTRWLPPSGFMAGICARVDNQRGVWKAPANEQPFNVVELKTRFTTGEQDVLNPRGVNLIRRFDEGGIRVWGARTLSSDPEVKYVNVRRTLIFLEATIDKNTQWVVFEPNTFSTWDRVTASIRGFLETQWREGALFGESASQAFFVRCDETTMTEDDIQNGRLICQIGVAIVRPAEFVIFRIEQITGFAKQ